MAPVASRSPTVSGRRLAAISANTLESIEQFGRVLTQVRSTT
jgi:hypothetical protein